MTTVGPLPPSFIPTSFQTQAGQYRSLLLLDVLLLVPINAFCERTASHSHVLSSQPAFHSTAMGLAPLAHSWQQAERAGAASQLPDRS